MILTNENYFSPEAQMHYMGASQFKAFQRCEAAALAEITGEYKREETTALLVGSYVDAHFEGTLDLFKGKHPEIFKRDGDLKSEYQQANVIIARAEEDALFSMLLSGKKQVICTGEIAGVPFKIKIDSLIDSKTCELIAEMFPDASEALGFLDGAIVDLKVMRDMEPIWSVSEGGKIPFIEAWGYDVQGAIYQAVEGNMLPFMLAVATKEKTPNLAALSISQTDLDARLAEVEELAPKFQAIKQGQSEPERCGKCDYCKATKVLDSIIDYRELEEW
jgi:hypothetical protein